jgi:uncharacterized protein YcbK (DUF882 family)
MLRSIDWQWPGGKLPRRRFLILGALTIATGLAPLPALAGAHRSAASALAARAKRPVQGEHSRWPTGARHVERVADVSNVGRLGDKDAAATLEKSVGFYNINTGEQLRTVYWCHGAYLPSALQEVNYLLRDYHANEVKPIDPPLLDILYAMSKLLDTNEPYQVFSGYRSPATNAKLRRHNRAVAVHSLHIEGKAVDIRLPGRDLVLVRRAALALQAGGVGYYPGRNFLHVDTGPVRAW